MNIVTKLFKIKLNFFNLQSIAFKIVIKLLTNISCIQNIVSLKKYQTIIYHACVLKLANNKFKI
jgi:hypothetical protein